MNPVNPAPVLDACPDPGTLADFCVGKLSQADLEVVAEHLGSCARCDALLHDLERDPQDDSVVINLKRCLKGPVPPEEAGHVRMEAAAKALPGSGLERAATMPEPAAGPQPEPPLPKAVGPYAVLAKIGH